MSSTSVVPKEVKVICGILKSMNVEDFDPRVISQLLEFTHKYISDIFEDALVFANHSERNAVEVKDIRLSIQNKVSQSFTSPPPREFTLALAEKKNAQPLPLVPEKFGVRLPPEKYCLTCPVYHVDPLLIGKAKESIKRKNQPSSAAETNTAKNNAVKSEAPPLMETPEIFAEASQLKEDEHGEVSASWKRKRESEEESDDYDEV